MRRLVLVLFIALTGCQEKKKNLFSEWTSTETNHTWHLEDRGYGSGDLHIWTGNASWCACDLDIYGTEAEAYGRLSNCAFWGDSSEQNFCSSTYTGQRWYSFSKDGAELKICNVDAATCFAYH